MTRPAVPARVAPLLALLVAVAAAGCSSAQATPPAPPRHVIAWNGAVPGQLQARQRAPAAACRASHLRVLGSGFHFVAGGAGGTGAVALRNTGHRSCRLTGRPAVRLVGAPKAPAQRQVDLPPQPPQFPEVLGPAAALRALPPGSAAVLGIQWSNWCVPGAVGSRKPQVPPKAVRITLGKGLGSLDANYNAVPACQAPRRPSTIGVRPFMPAPLPATSPWTTANVKATIQPAGGGTALTGRRGHLARFVVRLRNASRVPVRFDRCPLLAEELAPAGQTEVHQLNCRAAGSILPGKSLFFEMDIQVPASAPLGKNGLFWDLDPTGAQFPEAVSGLVVSG
ncbi:MAG: DUF4232 domain-containing protein [Actinobacteria bacterium]|nr:DUF4232 domain-containing protein [Actinomycetota bacterium]